MSLFKKNVPLKVSAIPFQSSEPKIKIKEYNRLFGEYGEWARSPRVAKLQAKIKITDGKIEESLNDFIQNVVLETPGIICHKSTKSVLTPGIPDYYFFPVVERAINVYVILNEGEEIPNKRLEEYFYQKASLFNEAYKWTIDKIVNFPEKSEDDLKLLEEAKKKKKKKKTGKLRYLMKLIKGK